MGKIEKISAPKAGTAERSAQRARRKEAVAKASTVTFTLEPTVKRAIAAQAKAAGMNVTHYLQMMVENHVIDHAAKGDPLATRLAAKRFVINHAVALAGSLYSAGKFDEHFILTVVREAEKSPEFSANYAEAVGGEDADGTRAAARARVSLNQQIGRVIKKAAGARSKRLASGKIARAQVTDAIVSTYTLLDKAA
ncbi:hypothetical protein Z946_2913 [Sulfitobacter noctilucicola]|uniref:Putative HicB family RNase H-like nuclease n=1 Tax=Sulfitobacter noctilucicola TaxID=1342301 RepID=A0A7W6Q4K2_9RHOB|nr:hypothetical protein [Sulfitobacter noctilucicola]KIN64029.1 hypothetical protein Z946_2913 [Sulfitobacter noctilucicola]MBB4175385.1 putative HicB family RNase H-like nuclease [Sulfitobacter noctilucicola]